MCLMGHVLIKKCVYGDKNNNSIRGYKGPPERRHIHTSELTNREKNTNNKDINIR